MKYYIALYEKLKQIYSVQSSTENDIPLICPSLRMYEKEDLELLKPLSQIKESSKISESYLKKQDVSYQLNTVPVSQTFWDVNPTNSLFTVYRDILDSTEIKKFEENLHNIAATDTSRLFVAGKSGKETKEYTAYLKYLQLYEESLQKIKGHLELFIELQTDEQKENWNDQLVILKKQKDLGFLELEVKGHRKIIEDSLRAVNEQSDLDKYLSLFRSAKSEFDASEKNDIISGNSLHDLGFIPYDFMDSETGWTPLKLSKKELEEIYSSISKTSTELPAEILSLDYDEKYITGIEVHYSFVTQKRNWFNKLIFNSEYFQSNGGKPVSDGKSISSNFRLPAFPKTMMLIKNLKINIDASISEKEVNQPEQVIQFGPLVLKQQLFINKQNNERFLKVVTSKKTIQSDQLNYMLKKADARIMTSQVSTGLQKPKEGTVSNLSTSTIRALRPQAIPVAPKKTATVGAKTVTPVFINQPFIISTKLFNPLPVVTSSHAAISFKITDSITSAPVYKCSLSIRGIDNKLAVEKETDENGQVNVPIPPGNYSIETMVDGYQSMKAEFNVTNTNPLTKTYKLEREQVKFTSYFLIGMICERIPNTIRE